MARSPSLVVNELSGWNGNVSVVIRSESAAGSKPGSIWGVGRGSLPCDLAGALEGGREERDVQGEDAAHSGAQDERSDGGDPHKDHPAHLLAKAFLEHGVKLRFRDGELGVYLVKPGIDLGEGVGGDLAAELSF